jgi:hypothetical protein
MWKALRRPRKSEAQARVQLDAPLSDPLQSTTCVDATNSLGSLLSMATAL